MIFTIIAAGLILFGYTIGYAIGFKDGEKWKL